jgi:hypothetical protein
MPHFPRVPVPGSTAYFTAENAENAETEYWNSEAARFSQEAREDQEERFSRKRFLSFLIVLIFLWSSGIFRPKESESVFASSAFSAVKNHRADFTASSGRSGRRIFRKRFLSFLIPRATRRRRLRPLNEMDAARR